MMVDFCWRMVFLPSPGLSLPRSVHASSHSNIPTTSRGDNAANECSGAASITGLSQSLCPPVTVINQQPPVIPPQTNAPAQLQLQFWYYCDSAKGYYPSVPSCPEA